MVDSVVITGLGTVGPYGCGGEPLARALQAGTCLASEIDRSQGHHRPGAARLAGLVGRPDLSTWLNPAKSRRMCLSSRMAVSSALMACAEAGAAEPSTLTSVCLSTTFGSSLWTERILEQIHDSGPDAVSPFFFTECVSNAPTAQVAINLGAHGPCSTIVQREAGPLLALARGVDHLRSGRADRVLAGAVDEMTPFVHSILDRFGALAKAIGGKEEVPRPFDRYRNGALAAEGATVLLLERENRARERGAPILARVRLCHGAFDSSATSTDWGEGSRVLAEGLLESMRRASLGPETFDRVVSGASGSLRGDRLEALVLRQLWNEGSMPPILAPKSVHGEYGGGLLASAVLAAQGAPFGPAAGFHELDPELGIRPHSGGELPPPSRTLVSSLASGGAAAWAVLERP